MLCCPDLHTASFGRINSYYVRSDLNEPDAKAMAMLLTPQIVLHDAGHDGIAHLAFQSDGTCPHNDCSGTLRGAATRLGIKAITVEIGNPQLLQVRTSTTPHFFS